MALTVVSDRGAAGTTAYDLFVRRNFRANTVYSTNAITKVMPTNQSHRGSTVRFWFTADLATAVTPLTETSDVTAQNVADSFVDVAINEYGAATGYTDKVLGTDMLEVDRDVAITNANQAVDSFEELARTALMGGTQVVYVGQTAQASITAADTLAAANVREAVAKLRNDNVPTVADGKYLAIVSPYTALDLREETGDGAWVTSRNYQDITGINNGFIGTFGGAVFYETSRVPLLADAGSTTTDVYQNVIVGAEALACAYAQKVSGPSPQAVVSPVVDKLQRFHHVGWKWFGGFDTFREESCWRIESASSIGAN